MKTIMQLRQRYRVDNPPLRNERRLELVLLGLGALIFLQLLWFGISAVREPAIVPVAPAADSLRAATTAPAAVPSVEESLVVQARPLFWESRRPNAVEDTAPPPAIAQSEGGTGTPARPLKSLLITGVYGAGNEGGVIVQYQGERRRIGTGQELDGWQLDTVNPAGAVFVSAGVRDERRLEQRPVATLDGASDAEMPAVKVDPRQGAAAEQKGKEPTLSLGGR